jgi:hypothetical protein
VYWRKALTNNLPNLFSPSVEYRDSMRGVEETRWNKLLANHPDLLTVNTGDGNLVETTTGVRRLRSRRSILPGKGAGTLFGLAITLNGKGVYFVDDGDNTLDSLH